MSTSFSQEVFASVRKASLKDPLFQEESHACLSAGLGSSSLSCQTPASSTPLAPSSSSKRRFYAARLGLDEDEITVDEDPSPGDHLSRTFNVNHMAPQPSLLELLQTDYALPPLPSTSGQLLFSNDQEIAGNFLGTPAETLQHQEAGLGEAWRPLQEAPHLPPFTFSGQELLPAVWNDHSTNFFEEAFEVKPNVLSTLPQSLCVAANQATSEAPTPPSRGFERSQMTSATVASAADFDFKGSVEMPGAAGKLEVVTSMPGHDVTKWAGLGWDLWEKGVTVGIERLLNSRCFPSTSADSTGKGSKDSLCQGGGTSPSTNSSSWTTSAGSGGAPENSQDGLQHSPSASSNTATGGSLLEALQQEQAAWSGQGTATHLPNASGGMDSSPSHLQLQTKAAPSLPSLADRLAATLETIQTGAPARKLLKTSHTQMLPGNHVGMLRKPASGFSSQAINIQGAGDRHLALQHFLSLLGQGNASVSGKSQLQREQAQLSQLALLSFGAGDVPGGAQRVVQGHLLGPQVQRAVGGSQRATISGMLMRAGEAVERKDQAAFEALCRQLKPYCRRRGKGMERSVYVVLQGLKHRMEGTAGTVVKRRLHITIQEMEKIRAWYYKEMPVCAFSVITSLSILIPKLRGHPHVHIVNFGEALIPQLPRLITLLAKASQNEETQASGVSAPALRSFKVTHVRALGLARPGRTEFETLQAPEALAAIARQVAVSLGVEFSFHGIILKDHSLRLLDEIQTRPGEALAVCSISEVKFFSDDLGDFGDGLWKMMQCARRLQPAVVCMIEEDVDASGPEFMPRLANIVEFMFFAHEVHDSLVASSNPKLMHGFEDYYWNLIALNIIGCEGPERRWRLRTFAQLSTGLKSFGFKPCPIDQSIVDTAQDMLTFYPEGWGIRHDKDRLNITWQGMIAHAASVWCL